MTLAEMNIYFNCSICSEDLLASQCTKHPYFQIIICASCNAKLQPCSADMSSGNSCGCCARNKHLIGCKLCQMRFCSKCIKSHLGKDRLKKAKNDGWECFFCDPSPLGWRITEWNEAQRHAESHCMDLDFEDTCMDISEKEEDFDTDVREDPTDDLVTVDLLDEEFDMDCQNEEVDYEIDVRAEGLLGNDDDDMEDGSEAESFYCTICRNLQKNSQFKPHPLLEVIICDTCSITVNANLLDMESGNCCSWCAKNDHLIACCKCSLRFCVGCSSKRSLGQGMTGDFKCGKCLPQMLLLEREEFGEVFGRSKNFYDKVLTDDPEDWSDVNGSKRDGYIVNIVREQDEGAIRIPASISLHLKRHQLDGIQFMWKNILQQDGFTDKDRGCILAHAMGLGKTLQVVSFLLTAMCIPLNPLRTALIICPVGVIYNWLNEFKKWTPTQCNKIDVQVLSDTKREQDFFDDWSSRGGIIVVGYESLRNLLIPRSVKSQLKIAVDILICDEAHVIKNHQSVIARALNQVITKKRIALSGTPIQNNLLEYYNLVNFVRSGLLGSYQDFKKSYKDIIEKGIHKDSIRKDVKRMSQQSYILSEILKNCVQRMDMNVMKDDVPSRSSFVITLRLSKEQSLLYHLFIKSHASRSNFFANTNTLNQIVTHPWLLCLGKDEEEQSPDNIVDETSDKHESMSDVDVDIVNEVTLWML